MNRVTLEQLAGYYTVWRDHYYQINEEGDRWVLQHSDSTSRIELSVLGRSFASRPIAASYAESHLRLVCPAFGDGETLEWIYSPGAVDLERPVTNLDRLLIVAAVAFALALIGLALWVLLWMAA